MDVLKSEYVANPPEYYEQALYDGRIKVNGSIDPTHVLQNGDTIEHIAHRHEPPVAEGVAVVALDNRVVAVDKPASMPMHPCGSYHFNTLTSILRHEFGYNDLRQVHRLDKLTSGLVLLAKSAAVAKELCESIGTGMTQKTYIARVLGCFPANAPLNLRGPDVEPLPKRHKSDLSDEVSAARALDNTWRSVDGFVEVNVSLDCKSHKDGVYECAPGTGRPSRTRFRKLVALPDGTDLVECRPRTGRTHQIRLHLQWLGHPIANDVCYGGVLDQSDCIAHAQVANSSCEDDSHNPLERKPDEDDYAFARRACPRCRRPPLPQPHPACIWLHALRYAHPERKWAYHTGFPAWAEAAEPFLASLTEAHTVS